ncbi:MAG: AAA family ATPase [Proteobacteria bacterium]|nr:AAA family ATPase [Pseudomonadota bacterium]
MLKLQGYTILDKIDETRGSLVYHGRKDGGDDTVIIKILKSDYPTPSEIARFKQEYAIIKSIDYEGVIKTYDIKEHNGSFALILENFGGVSLKELFNTQKIDIKTFLNIAIKLAEILGHIEKENIIHRDIKPSNILYNSDNGIVKITDFGISSVLTHENEKIYNPDVIEGTLAYISPEQTGRMNRASDYRTDLYSLGITLYEMLTGTVPFKSNDPMEVIHSHIAIKPIYPIQHNSEIPQVISDIVMKLLSKAPEDRYQNGFGLMVDLKECLKQLKDNDKIESFELAKHDVSRQFIIPQVLVGRGKEIDTLMSNFETASNGKSRIMLVAGTPGIGKSALVNEIHKPIAAKRGYYISGKYEQFRRDVPYSSIIQAFQGLVRQILSENEEKIAYCKENLLEALGPNGKVITDIIPDIELIIGTQPEIPELGPDETRNRFNFVFEKFVSVFPKKDHPVVLFLDDLQWADMASLQLINNIIATHDINHLLIIGAYRNNEVSDGHQLIYAMDEIKRNNIDINTITLGPLTPDDVSHLIINFLKCPEDEGAGLGKLVYKKTGGNPFFVNQFLKTLYDEKLIELNPETGWKWDAANIREMQVTDNLVDLLIDKINKLSENTREVLKICACIGNRFDLETLAYLLGKSIDDILLYLSEPINEGLINASDFMYFYHHDRIQEAAYSLIPNEEKSKFHYRIGKITLEKADKNDLKNQLFYIVDQLNAGSPCITDQKEKEELAELNLEAGKKARRSAAYLPAFKYLEKGMELLEKDCWNKQYNLAFNIYAVAIEVAYLNRDFHILNRLADTVIEHARTNIDRVTIDINRINACKVQEDFSGAISIALNNLKVLGIKLPKRASKLAILLSILNIKRMLIGKKPEDLIDDPDMTEPEMIAASQIFTAIGNAIYRVDPDMFALLVLKSVHIHLKYGLHPLAASAYAGYGIILTALGDMEEAYKFGNLALKITDKYNAKELKPTIIFFYNALLRHWKEHIGKAAEAALEGYKIGIETGNLEYAALNLLLHGWYYLTTDKGLEELEKDVAKYNQIIKQLKQTDIFKAQSQGWQVVLNLLGQSENPTVLIGKVFDENKILNEYIEQKNHNGISGLYAFKLDLLYIFNKYTEAFDYLKKTEELKQASVGFSTIININYLGSLIMLARYLDVPEKKQKQILRRVSKNQKILKKWTNVSPENFLHRFYMVEAERTRVQGKIDHTEQYFDRAIELSKKHGYLKDEGIANERAAIFYLSRGKEKIAKLYITDAYNCYSRWGALAKVKHLEDAYPELILSNKIVSDNDSSDSLGNSSTTGSTSEALDLSTVMKASQTISGEIILGKLLARMMKIVLENAGAEKGFIILEYNGKLLIEAEGNVGSAEITVLKSISIDEHEGLCSSIVNYIARTKKILILNNALEKGDFADDPYVLKHKSRSILCSAILNQGRLTGILYLENNLTTGAFTHKRLEILNVLSSQIAISIDNAKLYENLEDKVRDRTEELRSAMEKLEVTNEQLIKTRDALWGEMELAKKIQTALLPKKPELLGYEITAHMAPADEVGGDYYDIISAGGTDWVVIGDVSGHGVPSGLVMMMVQTAVDVSLRQNPELPANKLLTIVNKTIYKNISRLGENKYMTITVLAAHENGEFHFSGMHQDIMIYRADMGNVEIIQTEGMWIGIIDDIERMLKNEVLELNVGDVMLLFTDGITEAVEKGGVEHKRTKKGKMFGNKRLAEILCKMGKETTEEIKDKIIEELENYLCEDDVTMVVLKRLEYA